MYQVIDDPEEEEFAGRSGGSILPFIIGAILAGIVFFFVWLASPGQSISTGESVETPASRAAYLTALGETTPALRRARLLDYQRVYPDTDRKDAIQDQLDVINTAELRAWETVTRAVYDVRSESEEKIDALLTYEANWNGSLLGGRGEELDTLRGAMNEAEASAPLPDRSLEAGESPISDSIPSDILAGAPPQMAETFPIFTPPPVDEADTGPKSIVVEAKVRRKVDPNYPRAALRRKVGAIVTLAIDINEKGRVSSTELVEVETNRYEKEFIRAAERAAMRTRFHPKTIDGDPVPAIGVRKRYIFQAD
jgi:TonB family protein